VLSARKRHARGQAGVPLEILVLGSLRYFVSLPIVVNPAVADVIVAQFSNVVSELDVVDIEGNVKAHSRRLLRISL
jgi:hypothetical protein